MKNSFWTIGLLSIAALACSPAPGKNDGGEDGGDEPEEFFVSVSGKAFVHPVGAQYLADAGLPPLSLVGLTLRVEEPLKVATNNPLGLFGSLILDGGGTFSVANVPTSQVNLGISAGIRDERDAGTSPIIKSSTVVYDVILIGEKPRADITGSKAYAVPRQFHEALTAAVGEDNIKALTGTTNRKTLFEAGFTLGRIVDAAGNPVAGLTVTPIPSNLANRLFYPTADLSGTQPSTSANGLFLYVHTGGDVQTFRYKVPDHDEYKERRAGAVKDSCLVTEVYPGLTPPP